MNKQLKPVAVTTEGQVDLMLKSEVAWMYAPNLFEAGDINLYAIPDTHRVVSVELLKSYQAAIGAGQFMGFDEEYDQMQAIIDNKREA